ncbi:quinoprotein dehydrogenase-associated SoxYZ-like carrier [Spectribacter hydrogenoxidans]|uniref:Quinoprotein dehydrogenase-associated SoxYZ-like carrier n=1 Tax=Spectribacter hydrogenoxidans TaxID=3075608 RepID=A0ABU3BYK3_9GAMM|nr:quinoprotein dehydrogenase-associated SoxYZ-like carrier [Salinisphaera sp. W335]MDT0634396.1 quinoprotein dehydrogenase-associated SoxYZ-like carrier [Salinisphaera sp. W335]
MANHRPRTIRRLLARQFIAATAIAGLLGPTMARAATADDEQIPESSAWPSLKAEHFGDRQIRDGEAIIGLDAPYRAEDAAIVPIAITDKLSSDDERRIERLWLVIDNNPVPMSAEFEFGPAAASADIATRVRVNAYTHMRAIAETGDGQLYMTTRYVKASGGCSAPASKDPDAALANMGQIRLRELSGSDKPGRRIQMLTRHPNHTGLQMNQVTRLHVPEHYVNAIEINAGDRNVLSATMTFSLSENPSLRFSYQPAGSAPLTIAVRDTEENTFTAEYAAAP